MKSATARGADPSVASLPGVESVVGVDGVPVGFEGVPRAESVVGVEGRPGVVSVFGVEEVSGVVSGSQRAQVISAQSGTGARDEWQPSD